jgi:predicted nucleotidyltransferase
MWSSDVATQYYVWIRESSSFAVKLASRRNCVGSGMDIPERTAGLDARRVCGMFKSFVELKNELELKDGVPVPVFRRMTPGVIMAGLHVSRSEADRIQAALVAGGWIEPDKFTPTRQGMGLAQHIDRPKLRRAEAEAILGKVIEWADHTNAEDGARVKVKTIHLYGSLERVADEVGDIDLFVEFTTMDLEMDLQPEDMEREAELSEELTGISEYVRPSSGLDRMMMDDVPMRLVFPRVD